MRGQWPQSSLTTLGTGPSVSALYPVKGGSRKACSPPAQASNPGSVLSPSQTRWIIPNSEASMSQETDLMDLQPHGREPRPSRGLLILRPFSPGAQWGAPPPTEGHSAFRGTVASGGLVVAKLCPWGLKPQQFSGRSHLQGNRNHGCPAACPPPTAKHEDR